MESIGRNKTTPVYYKGFFFIFGENKRCITTYLAPKMYREKYIGKVPAKEYSRYFDCIVSKMDEKYEMDQADCLMDYYDYTANY